jgi:5-methyltetrahydrofolate--homocysteine methyltransferase
VWQQLDRNTLFRHHWGGHPAKGEEYERIVHEVFEPQLARLQAEALRDGWLEARIVAGYWPCRADGDQVIIFDPLERTRELARLDFPRQPDGDQLCLADYFRSDVDDVIALQAVSTGPRAGAAIEALLEAGDYAGMLLVNGLAAATAEALAEYAHLLARRELGLPPGRGLRFSWGYAACPDLDQQRRVLPLLDAEGSIGLRLTPSSTLDPEHSTAAMIVHHPAVSYFAVRSP